MNTPVYLLFYMARHQSNNNLIRRNFLIHVQKVKYTQMEPREHYLPTG